MVEKIDNSDQVSNRSNLASFLTRATILVCVLGALALAAGTIAYFRSGTTGIVATALSMGICLFCGLSALLVSEMLTDPRYVMYQVLLTMALRMGIPLTVCLVIHVVGGPLADAGMVYYLLAFYLVTLLVETLLVVNHQGSIRSDLPKSVKA